MEERVLSDRAHAGAIARLRVIDESDDYLVVDKPALLLVHPTKPNGARTLWGELRELLAYEIANGGQISIVNRLDRETSGVVLVAKNRTAARQFGLAMQRGEIAKSYLAIVHGWPEWDRHVVDAPIARQGKHSVSAIWLKQAIDRRGAPAITEFHVEQRSEREGERFALVRAAPRTGRTHQIRVHLASLGHPVVGDKIYGLDETIYLRFIETGLTSALESKLLLPRHALHSAELRLPTGECWQSDLPDDLQTFLRTTC